MPNITYYITACRPNIDTNERVGKLITILLMSVGYFACDESTPNFSHVTLHFVSTLTTGRIIKAKRNVGLHVVLVRHGAR